MIWINFSKFGFRTFLSLLDRLTPRLAAFLCGLLVFSCSYVPLWNIELYAPQYPEGLFLSIWIDKISGDVQSVNTLNHYVGMQKIDAKSIPELAYMPGILAFLYILAGVAAVIGKRWALGIWYAIFASLGSLGLWDFYRWEYEYGHNISAHAPIKIPGMEFQPPFLGSKEMLNITAYSLPDIGGWLLFAVGIIGILPFLPVVFRSKFGPVSSVQAKTAFLFLFTFVLFNSACLSDKKPEPIHLGHDHCHTCKMTITDGRFGAEVILKTGKTYKFDALNCLMEYIKEKPEVENVFLVDFFSPGQFVKAEETYTMEYPAIHGPMGSTMLTTSQAEKLADLAKPGKAEILRWPQVVSLKTVAKPTENSSK